MDPRRIEGTGEVIRAALLAMAAAAAAALAGPGGASAQGIAGVRITEVSPGPRLTPDWVELTHTGDAPVDLGGCFLRVGWVRTADLPLPSVAIAPGASWVLAADPFPDECGARVDLLLPGLSIAASGPQEVALVCPDPGASEPVEVSSVRFDFGASGAGRGRTLEWCPDAAPPSRGLDPGWRPSEPAAPFCAVLGLAEAGNPGAPGPCEPAPLPGDGDGPASAGAVGLGCASGRDGGGDAAGWLLPGLALAWVVARRLRGPSQGGVNGGSG